MILRKKIVSFFVVVALFSAPLIVTEKAIAETTPVISGEISGVEACIQDICHFAIFLGIFRGIMGTRPALGFFSAAAQHESPIPQLLGETVAITEG
ncbi:MAG: hypothetical protein HY695_35435 [Deltaproteobacteria bacterium]|nr:hypothetical protein [Deltaproteobacteria bacterium]